MVFQVAAKPTHEEQVAPSEKEMKNYAVVTEEEAVNTNKAPFVRKAFEMVSDPESDRLCHGVERAIVSSFGILRNSPKYFSQSISGTAIFSASFASLTPTFRKIDSERWEFANEAFQGGKKHLLKNIKSRRKHNKLHQGSFNSMKPCLEDEVEELKKDKNLLKVEILKLRRHHENSHTELSNVQERIQCAELKQHQMLLFLTRMVKKPTLVEQLMKKIKRTEELDGVDKRRRLLDTTPNVEHRHQGSEQLSMLQSELIGFLSEIVNTGKMEPRAPSSLEDQLLQLYTRLKGHQFHGECA